jgi:hypothetical protein
MSEPELGIGIDPGMVKTRLGLNPQPLDRELSTLTT